MLRIRLRRVGKTKKPYYRVVVAEGLSKRDGGFVDLLGSYDPHATPPSAQLDAEKAKAWIAKGAQPSEAVTKIFKREGIIEAATP